MSEINYKIGDRVRIKSFDWYNQNKDEFGVVLLENGKYLFFESDTTWCGKVITIVDVCLDEYYTIAEDFGKHRWTDEMIEGFVEDEKTFPPYMDYDIKENKKQETVKIMPNQIKDRAAFVDITNAEYNDVDTIELLCSDKFDVEIIHEDKLY